MTLRKSNMRWRSSEPMEQRVMLAAGYGLEDVGNVDVLGTPSPDGDENNSLYNDSSENAAGTDAVLAWNDLFKELLVADESNQNPGYASRSMAMMNLAIYDAVSIAVGDPDGTFYDYGPKIKNVSHVDAELAASQAAYTVLSELYPDQQEMLDAFFDDVLAGARRGVVTANSLALGRAIGEEVIAARADDSSGNVVDYEYGDGIGVFQADPLNPDVPVWGPGWGEVETFAISAAEDFAPETTPPITSEEYAVSYNEVKELGSVDSQTRTADETEAGIFWAYDREGLGTPLALYNDVLETIAIQQGNSLKENAALFAQASVAMADAAIVAWHTKFGEEFWRPVTAIHEGDNDGNDLTEGDENWTALGAPDGEGDIIGFTPQFPTYISGHATFGGAVFGALQQFYGTDDIAFELDSRELEILLEDPDLMEAYGLDLDDATRSFDSLSEAMAENGRSRVYLGIHFDFDDLVGQEVGQAVAAAVSSEFSVPTNGRDDGKGPKRGKDRDGKRPGRGGEGKSKRDKDGKKDGKRGDRNGVPLLIAGKKSGKPAGRGFTYFNSDDSSDGRGKEDKQKSPPPGRNEPVRVVDLDRDDDRPGKKQPPGENDGLLEYVGRRSKRKG